jgi:hypothetical protein
LVHANKQSALRYSACRSKIPDHEIHIGEFCGGIKLFELYQALHHLLLLLFYQQGICPDAFVEFCTAVVAQYK